MSEEKAVWTVDVHVVLSPNNTGLKDDLDFDSAGEAYQAMIAIRDFIWRHYMPEMKRASDRRMKEALDGGV